MKDISCLQVKQYKEKANRKKPGFLLDGTRASIEKDPEIGKLYFTETESESENFILWLHRRKNTF